MAPLERTLGLVLAGGASRRFGSDKADAMLGGETLLARAVKRATPQVDRVLVVGRASPIADVSAIFDETTEQGPLAGVLAGLSWGETHGFARTATFPCDVPFFPSDTVARLSAVLADTIDCAMAQRGTQKHPIFALWRTRCRIALSRAFDEGLRSLHGVEHALPCAVARFADGEDGIDPFFNINRIEDLRLAEQILGEVDR